MRNLKNYYNALLAAGRVRNLSITEAQADLERESATMHARVYFGF